MTFNRFATLLINVGVAERDSFSLRRRKGFFNIITFIGAFASIPQGIMAAQVHPFLGYCFWIMSLFCFLSILAHKSIGFDVARFLTFFPVFIFGSIAAVHLGHESYAHLSSLTILIGAFIIYDFKKEWYWPIFYLIFEVTLTVVVEMNLFNLALPDVYVSDGQRIGYFLGTGMFIIVEVSFFIHMSSQNEHIVNDQLRTANKELTFRNKEKDVLLKEIHHRVKNNLQIISSLLRLQSREIQDEFTKNEFSNAVNRIQSIASLHEKIYQANNLMMIDLKDYLETVSLNLIESYGIEKEISFTIESELKTIENDLLVPLSLILNELVSNSLKHGSNNQDDFTINVTIQQQDENVYVLRYRDSGNWKIPSNKSSFGTELIETLIEQIDGEVVSSPTEELSEYIISFHVT